MSCLPRCFWFHMLSKGICQIIMVEVVSSWRDCLVFLFTRRWPNPPETTSKELTFILLARRPLWWWAGSCRMSYRAPSSGPCSREPWEGVREPQDEDRLSWRAMVVQPASPNQTARPWGGCEFSSSSVSVGWTPVGGVEDGRLDARLHTAAAMVRNLTGPLWACKDTIPRPDNRYSALIFVRQFYTTVYISRMTIPNHF